MLPTIHPITRSCLLAGALLPGAFAAGTGAAPVDARPNIVVILADDLGYGDPGCYNPHSKIFTPNIDRLAANGTRFTAAHSGDAICTPSRYCLLTGGYCWRTRLKRGVLDGFSPPLIEAGQPTVASFLKGLGYQTAAIGKWHLGMQWTRKDGTLEDQDRKLPGFRPGFEIDLDKPITAGPMTVGFDSFFGISASLDMSPYCWIENNRCLQTSTTRIEDSRDMFLSHSAGLVAAGFTPENVLPTLKVKTAQWFEQHYKQSAQTPFFLYLALNAPHLPAAPSPAFVGKSKAGRYGDYVMEVDDFVGSVIERLRQHGAIENTVVVFTSDNGGLWNAWDPVEADDVANYQPTPRGQYTRGFGHQSNGELRGTKADVWEGGHRIPLIVQWPRRVKPSVTEKEVELTDLFATLADILAAPLPNDAAPDSFSFYPVLMQPETGRTARPFLVHHSGNGMFSITEGDWKYEERRGSGGFSRLPVVKAKPGEATGQLYNVRADIRESKNLFLSQPERVAHFEHLLEIVKKSHSLRLDTATSASAHN